MTIVAAVAQQEPTMWLPLGLGLLYFIALGFLEPFKNVVLRLPLVGVITSGSLAAWYISQPPSPSEPSHRITALVPILGALGPSLCLIVVFLLWEERKAVNRQVWNWLTLLVAISWLVSYYSASHVVNGLMIAAKTGMRYDSDVIRAHTLPHRMTLQVVCYGTASLAAVGLASASRASKATAAIIGLIFPLALVAFDEGRYVMQFADSISKRSIMVDLVSVATAYTIAMVANFVKGRKAADEPQ